MRTIADHIIIEWACIFNLTKGRIIFLEIDNAAKIKADLGTSQMVIAPEGREPLPDLLPMLKR